MTMLLFLYKDFSAINIIPMKRWMRGHSAKKNDMASSWENAILKDMVNLAIIGN